MSLGIRCKHDGGLTGEFFTTILIRGKSWAVVYWDGMDHPIICPKKLLLVERKSWVPLTGKKDVLLVRPIPCTGDKNTDKNGHEGWYFGKVSVNSRPWAVVRWCGDKEPDLYKAELLLVEKISWVSAGPAIEVKT